MTFEACVVVLCGNREGFVVASSKGRGGTGVVRVSVVKWGDRCS
jgi:hypothetical protein